MSEKTLNTRIALRIDTYENWIKDIEGSNTGANLVLKRGEIGLCEINANPEGKVEATTVPTVLFKVGDGEHSFKELNWASALAADVYDWAKKPEAEFKAWLDETAAFATDAEVEAIRAALAKTISDMDTAYKAADSTLSGRLDALEGKFTGEGSVQGQIDAINDRLDDIDGEEGLIAEALADAMDYTDTRETAITTEYQKYADQAETDAINTAKEYTDGQVDILEAKDTELAGDISDNANAIAAEVERAGLAETALGTRIDNVITAYGTADDAINAKFGAEYSADSTVADAIAVNTQAIADEATARAEADAAIDERLDAVEAFFAVTEEETLDTALDTLKEIQDYLNGEGNATSGIIGRVASLETFRDTTVPATYETIANVNLIRTDVSDLKTLTSGANGNAKLREDLGALDTRVTTAEGTLATTTTTANNAKAAAETNATNITEITKTGGVIDTRISDLVNTGAVKALADRVKANEDAIAALDDTYVSEDEFTGFQEANTEAIEAVADAVEEVASDVSDLSDRIDAYDARFGTATDILVFNCGTSTEVI